MNYPKISFIIPMYNVEQYIKDCLTSVIAQDYSNIEIVVVDDGSTDKSKIIAESVLSDSDREYNLISRHNKGVSATRNDGLTACTGEWIVMVDADDVVNKSFVSKLYENIDEFDRSCVVFSNYRIIGLDRVALAHQYNNRTLTLDKTAALYAFQKRELKFIAAAMLLNKQFVFENQIFFDEDCRYSEDVVYIWKILCLATRVIFVDIPLYDYVFHPGSTMTSSNIDKILTCQNAILRLYEDYITPINDMVEFKEIFLSIYFLSIAHSSAKLLDYDNFYNLIEKLNLDSYLQIRIREYNFKTQFFKGIYCLNKRLFYLILKNL